jgi:tetratricopeptide (TPR) repeat protein
VGVGRCGVEPGIPAVRSQPTPIVRGPISSQALPHRQRPEPSEAKPEETAPAASEAIVKPGAPAKLPNSACPGFASAGYRSATPKSKIQPSVMRAIVLHLEGRIEDAIQEIESACGMASPLSTLTAMGALQVELERYDDAAASYTEVLKHDPLNDGAKQHLALCVERAAEAKKPPKPSPSLVKAIALHAEGKLEEAIKELQRAMKSGEPALDVCAGLGHLQFEAAGSTRPPTRTAMYQARRCPKISPLQSGCLLEKTGRHKEALGSFRKALESTRSV